MTARRDDLACTGAVVRKPPVTQSGNCRSHARVILLPRRIRMKGTIGTATSTLRMWWFCLAICCIASTSAVACIPATERGIFFENVPTDIDAPVIIEATIHDESQVGDV